MFIDNYDNNMTKQEQHDAVDNGSGDISQCSWLFKYCQQKHSPADDPAGNALHATFINTCNTSVSHRFATKSQSGTPATQSP